MVKTQTNWTIDSEIVKEIGNYRKRLYPGLSKSAVVELLLRDILAQKREMSKEMSIVK